MTQRSFDSRFPRKLGSRSLRMTVVSQFERKDTENAFRRLRGRVRTQGSFDSAEQFASESLGCAQDDRRVSFIFENISRLQAT
jgi:hypothetical protein